MRSTAPGARHGLTPDDYDALLEKQLGVCALCFRDVLLIVDHAHSCCPSTAYIARTCGLCVRGLLCQRCNLMLGFLETSAPDVLVRALRYIDGHNPRSATGKMHDPLLPVIRQMLEYAESAV